MASSLERLGFERVHMVVSRLSTLRRIQLSATRLTASREKRISFEGDILCIGCTRAQHLVCGINDEFYKPLGGRCCRRIGDETALKWRHGCTKKVQNIRFPRVLSLSRSSLCVQSCRPSSIFPYDLNFSAAGSKMPLVLVSYAVGHTHMRMRQYCIPCDCLLPV